MKRIIILCTLFFIANTSQSFVFDDFAEEDQDLKLKQEKAAFASEDTQKHEGPEQSYSNTEEAEKLMERAKNLMSKLSIECFQNDRQCADYHEARSIYLRLERLSILQKIEQRPKIVNN